MCMNCKPNIKSKYFGGPVWCQVELEENFNLLVKLIASFGGNIPTQNECKAFPQIVVMVPMNFYITN